MHSHAGAWERDKLHDEPNPLAAVSCQMLDDHRIEIVLEQGKYHQVKRMLAAAENHCAALSRTQIGELQLDACFYPSNTVNVFLLEI